MRESVRDLVSEYVRAVGERRLDRVAELVHPEATFGGTVATEARGREAFVRGFRNLAPILDHNEIRKVVVDGGGAAVLYEFVTSTPAGAVLSAEFLTFEDGLIRSSTLVFDWRRWPDVIAEIQARRTRSAGQ
ncbi:MAG: nuclear transport factor 2 family protein [Actinomycetota bacterium]